MFRFAKMVDTMHDINTLPMFMVSEICESITGIRHILGQGRQYANPFRIAHIGIRNTAVGQVLLGGRQTCIGAV